MLLGTRGKSAKWQVGAYLAIPLAGYFGFGRITGTSLAAFYDIRSRELFKPDDLDKAPLLSSWVLSWKGVTTGRWPVIGHGPLEQRLTEHVKFVADDPFKVRIRLYGPMNNGDEVDVTTEQPHLMETDGIYPWWSIATRLANHFAGRRCLLAERARYRSISQKLAGSYGPERRALEQSAGDGPATEWPGILTQVFEYDEAVFWVEALVKSQDGGALSRAFASIPTPKRAWSLMGKAVAAWAAAAIVAAAQDGNVSALPQEVANWTARHSRALKLDELKPAAITALKHIVGKSELHALWLGAGTETACLRQLDDLATRLS